MNVSIYYRKVYKNETAFMWGKNKPNSNPIAERVKLIQMFYLQRIMKKNAANGYEKTKPKQTQFLQRPKMNANVFDAKDYENETAFRLKQNKPNQTQFRIIFYNVLSTEMLSSVRSDSKSFIGNLITFVFCEFFGGLIEGCINRRRLNYYRPQAPKMANLGIKKGRKKGLTFLADLGIILLIEKIPLGPGGGHLNNRIVKGVLSVKLKTLTN